TACRRMPMLKGRHSSASHSASGPQFAFADLIAGGCLRNISGTSYSRRRIMRFASLFVAVAVALAVPAAAHAAQSQPLVDAAWLKAHQQDGNVVVLDIRPDVEKTDLGDKP